LKNKNQKRWLNRRQFAETITAATIGYKAKQIAWAAAPAQRKVFLVPNFHPASCGWLTVFSRERVCHASYLA
jgi:hypothetical protein